MNIEEQRAIVSKVKFLDFRFHLSSCRPKGLTLEEGFTLVFHIIHYGFDSDKRQTKHNLTAITSVDILTINEDTVKKATYVALLQKLRHEASEIFQYEDSFPFHEHTDPAMGAGFPMIEEIIK